MWELDHKESSVPKNWYLWTVVLEKTLESPLNCKEIKPVHPKGKQSWIFIGRTYAEAEAPILWPPDEKSQLIWKDPDAGQYGRQEEKGMTEDEMVGWHHRLRHEFEQALGVDDGQGGLTLLQSMGSQKVGHNWATELNCMRFLPTNKQFSGYKLGLFQFSSFLTLLKLNKKKKKFKMEWEGQKKELSGPATKLQLHY